MNSELYLHDSARPRSFVCFTCSVTLLKPIHKRFLENKVRTLLLLVKGAWHVRVVDQVLRNHGLKETLCMFAWGRRLHNVT